MYKNLNKILCRGLTLILQRWMYLALIFLNASSIHAQRQLPNSNNTNFPQTGSTNAQDSIEQEVLEDLPPDTIRIYHPDDLKKFDFFGDTTLHHSFQQYEPIRLQEIPYLNLGNFASPHRTAMYRFVKKQGLDIGSSVMDVYRLQYDQLSFLDSKRAITKFRFAQQNFSQQDLQLEGKLAKTFQNGLHLDLYFHNQQYKGDFQEQIQKNGVGSFSIWYHAPKNNYDFIVNYLFNNFKWQDNGGISKADSLLRIPDYRREPLLIDAYRTNGDSRQRDQSFNIQNGFTARWKESNLNITHVLSAHTQSYLFLDKVDGSNDSLFYGPYFHKDTQIVSIKSRGISNELRVEGVIQNSSNIMAGIRHEYHSLLESSDKTPLNMVFLIGKLNQSIAERIKLSGYGQYGILDNLGEYYLHGTISAESKKWGIVEAHANFQRSPVPRLYRRLYNEEKLVYATNFDKPLTNQIGGSFFIKTFDLKAGVDQNILNNTVYFDSLRRPQQDKSTISITSFHVDKSFRVGKFHSNHRILFQLNTGNEVLRQAPWFIRNVVYYQSILFKGNMPVQIGVDSRILPAFRTKSYFPLTGNFYNDNNSSVVSHPALEGFINFQLSNFRGFVKYEGLEYFISKPGKVYYETTDQPLQRQNIRLGLTWIMRD